MIAHEQEKGEFFFVLRLLTGLMGVLTALAVGSLFWAVYCCTL